MENNYNSRFNTLGHNISEMLLVYLNYSSLHNLIYCYKGAKNHA